MNNNARITALESASGLLQGSCDFNELFPDDECVIIYTDEDMKEAQRYLVAVLRKESSRLRKMAKKSEASHE